MYVHMQIESNALILPGFFKKQTNKQQQQLLQHTATGRTGGWFPGVPITLGSFSFSVQPLLYIYPHCIYPSTFVGRKNKTQSIETPPMKQENIFRRPPHS
ncbi:conserved hypothetical protein [Trichinella spiralis]|uniref:hypothetical protein n=1 Tax=Trichinella spiralis TaxID=6334 RepID=UPI0001EFE0AD|nr:conserved hypothetical protein [Trichinella spiralis]